jgi:hypothetical protein
MREVQCAACDVCDVCDEAENDAYVPKTGAIIFMAILSTVIWITCITFIT